MVPVKNGYKENAVILINLPLKSVCALGVNLLLRLCDIANRGTTLPDASIWFSQDRTRHGILFASVNTNKHIIFYLFASVNTNKIILIICFLF
jgi:hypothetical protein